MEEAGIKQLCSKCNIYVGLWLLYNLQGILYSSGGLLSQVLLAIILVWSIFYFFKVNLIQSFPIYIKGLNILLIMFCIYGTFLIISGKQLYISEVGVTNVRNIDYLKSILISLLPIYPMYYYARRNQFTYKHLYIWFYFFLIVVLLQYFRTQREMLDMVTADEVTNNSGYLFVSLLPCLVIYRRKRLIQYIFLSISVFFILASVKRGAILIGVLSSIFIIVYNILNSSRKTRFWTLLLSVFILFISWQVVSHMMETNDYFHLRMEQTLDGDDSNRSSMYKNLFDVFEKQSSFIQMLFGRGAWGTLTVNMNFAHNDWLEILINQGLLGILIFLVYWILFFIESRNDKLSKSSRFCLFLIFFICLSKTIFSMSYSDMNIYIVSVLGLALADGFKEIDLQDKMN